MNLATSRNTVLRINAKLICQSFKYSINLVTHLYLLDHIVLPISSLSDTIAVCHLPKIRESALIKLNSHYSICAEIAETSLRLCRPLLRGRECVQDMVVRVWGLTNSLSGQCLRERRSSMYNGAVLVALSHDCCFPRVRSLPSHLPPPDLAAAGLCISLPGGFRCGVRVV